MPAIQLARLRLQAAQLAENFDQPAVFVRALHELLKFYADRAHRPGQAGAPRPLITPYNVPKPVLRQVEHELILPAAAAPQAAAELVDALWAEPYLECRLLACYLLGLLPTDPPEPVMARGQAWASSGSEDRLLEAIVQRGLSRVRTMQPVRYLEFVLDWLSADSPALQQLGLMALQALAGSPTFDNMPAVFHAITPFIRATPLRLQPFLMDVLQALILRSPQETAHYLRKNLGLPGKPGAAWLIRQLLVHFPPDIQESLRAAVRGTSAQKTKGG